MLALILGVAAGQALACYTVYDRSGRVLYSDPAPPVDMSRPLHDTLQARFPGAHMVFDAQADCGSVSPPPPAISASEGAPLLTDRRTAQAMNVPFTVMQGNIVMVPPRHGRVGPGVTVLPPGAGAAPQGRTAVMGAAAAPPPGRGAVITELRDPPMTIVQSPDGKVTGAPPR